MTPKFYFTPSVPTAKVPCIINKERKKKKLGQNNFLQFLNKNKNKNEIYRIFFIIDKNLDLKKRKKMFSFKFPFWRNCICYLKKKLKYYNCTKIAAKKNVSLQVNLTSVWKLTKKTVWIKVILERTNSQMIAQTGWCNSLVLMTHLEPIL